jgi:hypothetical protein
VELQTVTVPKRWSEEALYDYLERIALLNGWMQPLRGRPVVRSVPAVEAAARVPGEEG